MLWPQEGLAFHSGVSPVGVTQSEPSPGSTLHPCTPPQVQLIWGQRPNSAPSTRPPDLLSYHVISLCTSISSCHISVPAMPMGKPLYPSSPELHSPWEADSSRVYSFLGLSPRNPAPGMPKPLDMLRVINYSC